MSELDTRIEALTAAVTNLATQANDTQSGEKDRYSSIKAELTAQATELESLLEEKRKAELHADIDEIKASLEQMRPASKAASILRGADDEPILPDGDGKFGAFLNALAQYKSDPNPDNWAKFKPYADVSAATKATVGDTSANGLYVIPNNFVGQVVQIAAAKNIYRSLMNVVPGVRGRGVDIPYELSDSSLLRAQLQGGEATSYGSNKDTRDFTLGSATATLAPIARIIDVGNQLLRYSEGAAENLVRSKLGRAFGLGEAYYILSGTGTNQPKGILTSLNAASSTYATALSSESRLAAVGRGLGALELRAYTADAVVFSPTDWWEAATETLGTSGSGGWALAPAPGSAGVNVASLRSFPIWGVPAYRDASGFLTVGTALAAEWGSMDLYFGDEYRIDVSTEANTRWDRNVTGFRAEEEMAFNADPYVLTGMVQKITGI